MAGIIWSDEARDDLDSIFLRLNAESQSYSKKWINEVFKKTDLLKQFPAMGRGVPEIRLNSIREIFAGNYRILYNIGKDNNVEIMAIRHSAKPLSEF